MSSSTSPEPVRPTTRAGVALGEAARERGFLTAWGPVELPPFVAERYRRWLGERRHASMGQLARGLDVRLDPAQRFGWVRSVLVLAAPHGYDDPGAPPGGIRDGRVARAFWVREQDYVQRLVQPHLDELKALAHALGAHARDYVDQGILPLRSHAANAGLGWIGRNGMLIRPGLGGALTLAALLTDCAVSAPQRHPDRCGTCRACEAECPTGALVGDGVVDARVCISYWTTQHPGLLPDEAWDGLGGWVLGCDLCQEACPWEPDPRSVWGGYAPEPELAHPDLRAFFSASGPAFAAQFAGSAFERAGRQRVARNAVVALAASGHEAAPLLARLGARDVDPVVRATAARALARLGEADEAARLRADPDPLVAAEAARALA